MSNTSTEYKLHPIVRLFPKMVGPEREALKADIAKNGVKVPIVVKDGMIIDGQNRWSICQELNIECPVEEFRGDESEALADAIILNLQRRQLTASQRAAIAVMSESLFKKYGGAAFGATCEKDGDVSEAIAREAGTNRTYVFKAKELKSKAPDLLKKVRDGELSIEKAMKELAAKLLQEAGGEEGAGEEGGEGEEEGGEESKKKEDLTDAVGLKVPKKLRPVFEEVAKYDSAIDMVAGVKKLIEGLGESDAAAFLNVHDALSAIKDLTSVLREAKPHTTCLECRGKGCEDCHQKGFINNVTYRSQKADKAKAEDEKSKRAAERAAKAAAKAAAQANGEASANGDAHEPETQAEGSQPEAEPAAV